MINIFLGAATALIIVLIGGGCFYFGIRTAEMINKPEQAQCEKEQTEEEKKRVEGLNNMLNHALRHKGGVNR